MKNLIVIAGLLLSFAALAQEEKGGITKKQFAAAKKLSVKNLEKDTYIKADSFILDRFNERPAYVFKFSDGIERRIYLYKVFEIEKMKEVAMLAFFQTPKDGKLIKLCIPNALADKEVWGIYIDDLKDGDKLISGFSACVAFVLSREFSGLDNGGKKGAGEDYEYCFPKESTVQMADGTEKNIASLQKGDLLLSMGTSSGQSQTVKVKNLQVHTGKRFALHTLVLAPEKEVLTASTQSISTLKTLEATANHPICTSKGKKRMDEVKTGDKVYVWEGQGFSTYNVQAVVAGSRTVNEVYNVETEEGNYVVDGVAVYSK